MNKDTILVCKYWNIIITEQRKNLTSNAELKNPLKKNFKEINRETVKQLKLNSVNNDGSVISMKELISQNNYSNLLYGEKKFMKKNPEKSPRHLLKNNIIKNEKENENVKKVQFTNKEVAGERGNGNENDDKISFKNIGNLTELIIDDNAEMNDNYNNIGSVSVEKNKNKDKKSFNGENEEQIILNSIIKNREFDSSDFTKCDEKTEKTNSTFSSESSKNSPTKHKNDNENSNKNGDKNGFEITDGEKKEQNKNKDENDVTENNNNDNDNTDYNNNDENEKDYDDNNDNIDDDENGNFDHLLMHVKEIRSESQLTDLIEFIQNRYISIEQTDNEKKKLKRIIKGKK